MEIKIWLGDLGAYNEGRLVGEWLTLPMPEEELRDAYNKYTHDGTQDFFIADHETPIKGLVHESSDPFKLNALAETLADLSDDDFAKVEFLIEYQNYSADDALDDYKDVDFYPDMNLKQLAEEFVDQGYFGEIPDTIANYIDYDAIARDLGMDYTETEKGCFRHD